MAYEHKEGSGTLFINRKKTKPTQPDWQGEIMVNGVLMNLAAWTKLTKNGDEWLSVSVSEKREEAKVSKPAGSKFDKLEDDIPF